MPNARAFRPAHIDGPEVVVSGIVEDRDPWRGAVDVPQEGAEDDRELQPLAPMDGEHLDGLGVRIEATAAVLVVPVLPRLVDPTAEPGRQCRGPEAFPLRLGMEELRHVMQVGQVAAPPRSG